MKIPLPTVVLMSIDVVHPERTLRAMERMRRHCDFQECVLFTDTQRHAAVKSGGIRIVHHTESDRTFPILSDNGRISHPDYELANLILPAGQFQSGTTHVFYVEHDSGIREPKAWRPKFLEFDFIGAPWPVHGFEGWPPCDGRTNAVGNFGFSLRSRRFCELVAERALFSESDARFSSDAWACRTLRPELESLGIRYAPLAYASRFSCEDKVYTGQFGFHGHVTMQINGWKEEEL